jgi:hypothetical protein
MSNAMPMHRAEFALWVIVALLLFIASDVGQPYHATWGPMHDLYSFIGIVVLGWSSWRFWKSGPFTPPA